jgi:hypothetical protein
MSQMEPEIVIADKSISGNAAMIQSWRARVGRSCAAA